MKFLNFQPFQFSDWVLLMAIILGASIAALCCARDLVEATPRKDIGFQQKGYLHCQQETLYLHSNWQYMNAPNKQGTCSLFVHQRIAVNSANAEMLETIPGIGPATAKRLIETKQRLGSFTAPEDLLHIEGIGPTKAMHFSKFLSFQ